MFSLDETTANPIKLPGTLNPVASWWPGKVSEVNEEGTVTQCGRAVHTSHCVPAFPGVEN